MSAWPRAGLARLALRRTAPPALVLATTALLVLVALRSRSLPDALLAATPDAAEVAGVRGALVRQAVWGAFALLVGPVLVARAAGSARRWRRREAHWLAPTPLPLGGQIASAFLGAWLGAGLLVALAAAAAEAGLRGGDVVRLERELTHAPVVLAESDRPARLELDLGSAPPDGARLLVEATVAPGSGPAVDVRLTLAAGDEPATETSARISGRTRIPLELPRRGTAGGPLSLTIARMDPGAVLVVPPSSATLLSPCRSARMASAGLARRAWLALGVWMALAAALGAWMRPSLAAVLALGALALAARTPALHGLVPGADLVRAWELVGRGIVPPAADWRDGLGLVLPALVAAGLARSGLEQRRFAA